MKFSLMPIPGNSDLSLSAADCYTVTGHIPIHSLTATMLSADMTVPKNIMRLYAHALTSCLNIEIHFFFILLLQYVLISDL